MLPKFGHLATHSHLELQRCYNSACISALKFMPFWLSCTAVLGSGSSVPQLKPRAFSSLIQLSPPSGPNFSPNSTAATKKCCLKLYTTCLWHLMLISVSDITFPKPCIPWFLQIGIQIVLLGEGMAPAVWKMGLATHPKASPSQHPFWFSQALWK